MSDIDLKTTLRPSNEAAIVTATGFPPSATPYSTEELNGMLDEARLQGFMLGAAYAKCGWPVRQHLHTEADKCATRNQTR